MVEDNGATPVPRRVVSARKGQTPGRRPRRGHAILVPDRNLATVPRHVGSPARATENEVVPFVAEVDAGWMAMAR